MNAARQAFAVPRPQVGGVVAERPAPVPGTPVRGRPFLGVSPRSLQRERSDEWLAGRVGRMRPEPFEILFERHWPEIARYCASQLGCRDQGADAAQDAMLSAYAHLRRSPGTVAFRPWLYSVARNTCIDRLRQRTARPQTAELPSDDDGSALADQADPLEIRERLRTLVADLHALSHRQRSALLMREVSGLGHSVIAQELGTTPGRAKALLFEARQTLAERRAGRAMGCDQFAAEATPFGRRRPQTHRLGAHLAGCVSCRSAYELPRIAA